MTRNVPPGVSRMWTVWTPDNVLIAAFPSRGQCDGWLEDLEARQATGDSVVRVPRSELEVVRPR